jgi:hypothetical protein
MKRFQIFKFNDLRENLTLQIRRQSNSAAATFLLKTVGGKKLEGHRLNMAVYESFFADGISGALKAALIWFSGLVPT